MILERTVHDGYSSLRRRFFGGARSSAPRNETDTVIQSAGSIEFPIGDRVPGEGKNSILVLTWPDVRLCVEENAFVVGDEGYLFNNDGVFIDTGIQSNDKIRFPIRILNKTLGETCFLFTGGAHDNRAHLLLEYLPRLYAFTKAGFEDAKILIPPGHRTWLEEYTALFDIDENRLLECSPGTIHLKKAYYIPRLGGNSPFPNLELYREMLEAIRRRPGAAGDRNEGPDPESASTIYISRADAPARRILNEESCIEILSEFLGAIDRVILSQYSLKEQLAILAKYDVIVAQQGQGSHLTSLFTNKRVIILDCPRDNSPTWGNWFAVSDRIAGNEVVRIPRDSTDGGLDGDFAYDPDWLRHSLERFLT